MPGEPTYQPSPDSTSDEPTVEITEKDSQRSGTVQEKSTEIVKLANETANEPTTLIERPDFGMYHVLYVADYDKEDADKWAKRVEQQKEEYRRIVEATLPRIISPDDYTRLQKLIEEGWRAYRRHLCHGVGATFQSTVNPNNEITINYNYEKEVITRIEVAPLGTEENRRNNYYNRNIRE